MNMRSRSAEFRRQSRGVGIPVEDVERRRAIAHDPVVGDEQPHEVVGPQPRKHSRHLAPFEHTDALRLFDGCRDTGFRSEPPSMVGASVSSTVTSNVALSTLSSPLAARCPSNVASVKAAGAGGHGIHSIGAGYFARHRDSFLAGREIGLDVPARARRGIAPADAEVCTPLRTANSVKLRPGDRSVA